MTVRMVKYFKGAQSNQKCLTFDNFGAIMN